MFNLKKYLEKTSYSEPLAVFRIGFGILMCYSIIRFWRKGWIETLYLDPIFHFSYYGFEWAKPLGEFTYVLFIICFVSSLFITIGFKYRISIILFFLSFTYIELMDKTTYLNHYYFISILSFLMCFLPLNSNFSLDNVINQKTYSKVPSWTIDSIKFLLCIVYFYAGLAKLNSDWLVEAMPLKIWLPSKFDLPLIGENLMQYEWVHYFMSWAGMFYDLFIPFLLLYKPTRIFAFLLVIFFHVFTKVLFPIGMFPFIMIVGALIFFDHKVHSRLITFLKNLFTTLKKSSYVTRIKNIETLKITNQKLVTQFLCVFFIFQLLIPFRYVVYPGELFWNEQGYRFSWRVMLKETVGYTTFKIVDKKSGKYFYINNEDFLTPFQEKQMSFQPDFILEYANYLGDYYKNKGHQNIQVFADSFVALNGRRSQRFVDKDFNLYGVKESFKNKKWILPLNDEIKGI